RRIRTPAVTPGGRGVPTTCGTQRTHPVLPIACTHSATVFTMEQGRRSPRESRWPVKLQFPEPSRGSCDRGAQLALQHDVERTRDLIMSESSSGGPLSSGGGWLV